MLTKIINTLLITRSALLAGEITNSTLISWQLFFATSARTSRKQHAWRSTRHNTCLMVRCLLLALHVR
jgi:hypothetical protein